MIIDVKLPTKLQFLNDHHWPIIGGILILSLLFWLFGCQSKVNSLLDPNRKVTRAELQNETAYLIGQAKTKLADLDDQDAVKKLIIDQASMFSTTGTFNPSGLLNTIVSIGAISFGMNRNQIVKKLTAEKAVLESNAS
jgi:arginine exporter protein ArgO